MNVFLDTNAFYNNWFIDNAHFKSLFNYLNNEKFDLVISELVIQEVNNIQGRESNEACVEIERLLKKLYKLNKHDLGVNVNQIKLAEYDLLSTLQEKVYWLEVFSYEDIPHSEVVDRALNVTKPFAKGEKGYRDTMIWLSFLDYLKSNNVKGDIAFITNNKNDFFEGKKDNLTLHAELARDVTERGIEATIHPYKNIHEFLDKNVDRIEHSFDRESLLYEEECFLIDGTVSYLDQLGNEGLSSLFNNNVFSEKLTEVVDISSSITDGLEDETIDYVSKLENDMVYVSFNYEMKGVDLVISINSVEFKQHATELESLPYLYNIEHDGDIVKLSFYLRLSIDAALEYDSKSEECSNLTIDNMAI
ncbi:PIN domain-containing protein [Vibrio parahaemolyticus]|uniref:PIN domain-containing protein n=1 Tax=Vibrio parahaemolyticus TaxID=670 RepID=UPI00226B4F5E|nr:PIN domain-containing protein [Vibrio parahaemolyticus]MCX8890695.1 PIN domain-containing protein [Vibrio parahaemolyticus]